MFKPVIFVIISAIVYPVLIYKIAPLIGRGSTSEIGQGIATLYAVVVFCVMFLILSTIISRYFLGSVWPGLIAAAVGLLLTWGIDKHHVYRYENKVEISIRHHNGQPYKSEGVMFKAWHGQSTFYYPDSEIIRVVATYRNSKLNGRYQEFYENGQLKIDGKFTSNKYAVRFFEGGELSGSAKFYFEDGTLDDVRKFRNGEVTYSRNYDLLFNNADRIISMKTGRPLTKKLNKSVFLTATVAIPQVITVDVIDGHPNGPCEVYSRISADSMRIAAEGWFENGKQVGQWKFCDENGEFKFATFGEAEDIVEAKAPTVD